MTDRVWVPRGALNTLIAHAETSGDLGIFGRRALDEIRAALSAARSGDGEAVAWRVGWIGCTGKQCYETFMDLDAARQSEEESR